ncbi:hypothetical protein EOL73_02030 [Candidatus Saccharibacteria bacterium]|nr:hypothetical protein [Candidatus Saccharibacteria bacterium]NCU40515.1 hypothetical protein [Candidatus Saccharibacteria bacterium]
MSKRYILRTIAVSAVVFTLGTTPLAGATSPQANVPGNNGTIKVHEQGTPANSESNDPKVCSFNFEGYGFDKGQSGVIVISSQMNGKDTVGVKQVDMPTANSAGYTETAYINVLDGHYKTTVYSKDTHGNTDYNRQLKAKSKVIKVQCNQAVITEKPVDNPGNGNGNGTDDKCDHTPENNAVQDQNVSIPTGYIDDEAATTTRTPQILPTSAEIPTSIPKTGNTLSVAVLVAMISALTYLVVLKRQ